MPGLIQQAQQPTQAQANPADVDRIVVAAKEAMSATAPQLLKMMQAAGDPVRALAQTLIFLMKQLYEKSKGTMPPQAVIPAAQQVLADLAKIGESGGLFKATPEMLQKALAVAAQLFMREQKMDPNAIMAQAKGAPQGAAPQPAPQAGG